MTKISAADQHLKHYLRPDSFQWGNELKAAYPEAEFWWLYQTPQA
jgi:hypothetical protein